MCLDKNSSSYIHQKSSTTNRHHTRSLEATVRTVSASHALSMTPPDSQIDLSKVDRAPTPTANAEDTPARQRLPLAQLYMLR